MLGEKSGYYPPGAAINPTNRIFAMYYSNSSSKRWYHASLLPISGKTAKVGNCAPEKQPSLHKITEAMKCTIISGETIDDGSEMIQQLKEKFQSTAQRNGYLAYQSHDESRLVQALML